MVAQPTSKKIAPAAIVALKEALSQVYWYKGDLRTFLTNTLGNHALVNSVNWNDYKRNIVGSLVDFMAKREGQYQNDLIRLMAEVSRVDDFSHLERLEGGTDKARSARAAVKALREHTRGHDALVDQQQQVDERRQKAREKLMRTTAVRGGLEQLNAEYMSLIAETNPQKRGYRLEQLLRRLFELFDLDPRASFKILGEQIDGAFTFEATDYLFEAKWEHSPIGASDLDVLAAKLSRKLDNTLGLFLSINGFSDDGISAHSAGRRVMILMDGSDLMAVLEGRIDLIHLLLRKRREASQTGNIYLRIHEII
jgi:hypothetical protein